MMHKTKILLGAAATVLATAVALSGIASASSGGGKALTGTLDLSAGKLVQQHGRAVYTGTYFRMLLPGKTDEYFSNPQSRAKDKTYTLLRPGSQGGRTALRSLSGSRSRRRLPGSTSASPRQRRTRRAGHRTAPPPWCCTATS
jgi:hypothetical protein